MANKAKPKPATAPSPEIEEDQFAGMQTFRIPLSNIENPLKPLVRVLEIVARNYEDACEKAQAVENPYAPSTTQGIRVLPCRFEEALPFLRQGFGIRRETWNLIEVMFRHPHVGSRLDIYMRNPDQPHFRVQFQRSADLDGNDIMGEDWSVCPKPPNFS